MPKKILEYSFSFMLLHEDGIQSSHYKYLIRKYKSGEVILQERPSNFFKIHRSHHKDNFILVYDEQLSLHDEHSLGQLHPYGIMMIPHGSAGD